MAFDDDSRPADVAKSFNFCDRPTLGGFIAIEWWAITCCDSLAVDWFCVADVEINLLEKRKIKKKKEKVKKSDKKKWLIIKMCKLLTMLEMREKCSSESHGYALLMR